MKILILSCGAAAIVGGLYVLGIVPKDVLAGAIGLLLGLVFGLPVKLVTSQRPPAAKTDKPSVTVHEDGSIEVLR